MSNANQNKKYKNTNNYIKKNRNTHLLRKRNPPKSNRAENAVYVTTKTGIKQLLEKCESYFNSNNVSEFYIYSIGRAIERALNLALQLTEKFPCDIEVNTSTVTLTDDLEPLTDDFDYETQTRNNSMLHVRVVKSKTTS